MRMPGTENDRRVPASTVIGTFVMLAGIVTSGIGFFAGDSATVYAGLILTLAGIATVAFPGLRDGGTGRR